MRTSSTYLTPPSNAVEQRHSHTQYYYATSQPQGDWDRSGCSSRSVCWRSKPANRALRSRNNIPISLSPTEPRSANTQIYLRIAVLILKKTKQLLKNNGTYSVTFTVVILHKAGNIHYRCFSSNQPANVHWSTSTCPLTTPTKSHPHKFNYCDFLCDTISTRKIRKSKVYAKHYSITVAKPVS